MPDILFIASSPLGYQVTCSALQWDSHIVFSSEHTVMSAPENIEATKQAIENPECILKSDQRDDRHIYYGKTPTATYGGKLYTKVVVSTPNPKFCPGELITAFPVKEIKGGVDGNEVLYQNDRKIR